MENSCKTRVLPDKAKTRYFSTRTVICLVLGSLLFFAGIYTDAIFKTLTEFYQEVFLSLGLTSLANKPQAGVSDLITMRSVPAIVTYGAGYVLLSVLFIHFYFSEFRKSLLTLYFYGSIFLACLILILIGKAIPNLQEAYRLARHLIEFVVSPFPIVFLIAAFKAFPSSVR